MKRLLALALWLCAMAYATAPGTHIVDVWTDGSGDPLSGTLSITWPSFTTAAGQAVTAGSSTLQINSGVINLSLQPTVGATSAATSTPVYSVVFYDPSGAIDANETWSVPVSDGIITLGSVVCPGVTGCPTGTTSGGGTTTTTGLSTPTFTGIPYFTSGSQTSFAATASNVIGLFGSITAHYVLAAPAAAPGLLSPRALVSSDIPALSYQSPLSFTGNGALTVTSTGTRTNGDCAKWDINGNAIDSGAPCATLPSGAANLVVATPNGTSGSAALRALVAGDIPALSYQAPLTFTGNGAQTASSTGTHTTNNCAKWDANGNVVDAGITCAGGSSGGSGTVNSASTGQFAYYAANGSTVSGHTLVAGDIPSLSSLYQGLLSFTGNGTKTASSTGSLTANDCAKWDANGNVVDAGAACGTATLPSGAAHLFIATPSGSSGASGLRAIVASDIPALSYQAPLTFTGSGAKTASSTGAITANDCAKWDSAGNVIDAGAVCGTPTLPSGTGNQVLATPNGSTGPAALRNLVAADIPSLPYQGVLTFTGTGSKTASSTGAITSGDCGQWDSNGNITDAGAPCGGAVTPNSTTAGNIPQYGNLVGTLFTTGLGVVTSVGNPGSNSNVPTEAAVNSAINTALLDSGNLPVQTGTAGYLVSNGTTASWGNISTGGSGALDCATIPGTCDIVTAVVPIKQSANLFSGQNTLVGGPAVSLTNASLTGTAQWYLVKLTGSPSSAVIASTSDTTNIIGIAVDGVFGTASGWVYVQLSGLTQCAFDGATTAGDWVQISSTVAGACHDTASSTRPTSHQIIGRVLSTNATGGVYQLLLEQDGH